MVGDVGGVTSIRTRSPDTLSVTPLAAPDSSPPMVARSVISPSRGRWCWKCPVGRLEKDIFFLNEPNFSTAFHVSIHFINRWL